MTRWTPEEENLLREYSKKYITKTIAKKMNKSVVAIQKKALKLGIELHGKKDIWIKWKEDYLKDNVNKKSINEISKFIEITPYQINKKLKELNIVPSLYATDWTDDEIRILKKYAPKCHYTELVKYLPNRSIGAISYKIHDLRIKHISEYTTLSKKEKEFIKDNWGKLTISEIAKELNTSYSVIQRYKKELNLPTLQQNRKWTDEIINKIREDAKTMTKEQLAKKYKTSTNQISCLLSKYKIKAVTKKFMWTIEQKEEVLKLYSEGKDIIEISKKTSIPEISINNYLKRLNVFPTKNKRWTEEEIIRLKELLLVHNLSETSKILNRSEDSIRRMASKYNISLKKEFWTEEKINMLIEYNKDYTPEEIAEKFNLATNTIVTKLKELSITPNYNSRKNWTEEEKEKLEILSKTMTINEIAKELGRSTSSIEYMLSTLNIKQVINKVYWTPEEINYLIDNYNKISTSDIALELNKTESSIINKANRLKIKKGTPKKEEKKEEKRRIWTKEEEELLSDLWGNYSVEYIANRLNRSVSSIRNRVFLLDLGSFNDNFINGISLGDICRIFSISRIKLNDWILLGLNVKIKKISNFKEFSYVEQKDLMDFLYNNQDVWNSTYLEENILGIEPDWLIEKRKSDKEYKPTTLKKQLLLKRDIYYAKDGDKDEHGEN